MQDREFFDKIRLEKMASVLTAKGRRQVKPENFALPKRRYPIHDLGHAKAALGRVAQHGTLGEIAKVRSAVYRRYPQLCK